MTIIWIVVSCFLQGTENCEKTSEPCPVFARFSRDSGLWGAKQGSPLKKTFSLTFSTEIFFFPSTLFGERKQKKGLQNKEKRTVPSRAEGGQTYGKHVILQGACQKLRHSVGTFWGQTGWWQGSQLALWGGQMRGCMFQFCFLLVFAQKVSLSRTDVWKHGSSLHCARIMPVFQTLLSDIRGVCQMVEKSSRSPQKSFSMLVYKI